MTPNPRDLELQRNNAHNTHNAASSRATSLVMPNQESSNNDAVLRVSGASSSERTVNHLRYADLNHVGYATLPPSTDAKAMTRVVQMTSLTPTTPSVTAITTYQVFTAIAMPGCLLTAQESWRRSPR
jgi:hypothetical protein